MRRSSEWAVGRERDAGTAYLRSAGSRLSSRVTKVCSVFQVSFSDGLCLPRQDKLRSFRTKVHSEQFSTNAPSDTTTPSSLERTTARSTRRMERQSTTSGVDHGF